MHSEILFQRIINSVKPALLQTGKIERRFAQRFAGNRPAVNATSPHVLRALDDSDPLAKIRRLGAGLFSSRAAANYDQIKIFSRAHSASLRQQNKGYPMRTLTGF